MSSRPQSPLVAPEQSKAHYTKRGKVRPIRLTDQIVDIIKDQIFSGALLPGDRVVEQKLAHQLGVGQNAIREALISLAHAGFLRRVPNKGTYVIKITQEDGRKIARIRGALEGLVIDLVIERMMKEPLDLTPLYEQVEQMRQLLKARDIVTFYERDIEYHRTLWQISGDEYLSHCSSRLLFRYSRSSLWLTAIPSSSSKRSRSPRKSTRRSPTA